MNTSSIALLASLLACGSAVATDIAYDGFSNGPRPDLDGSNGGAGWSGAWQDINSSMQTWLGDPGLSFPRLRTSPGAAHTASGGSFDAAAYSRSFGPLAPPANHVFISFLLRADAGSGTFGGLSFGGYTMFGMPLTMSTYSMRLGRFLFVDTGIPVVEGETALIVLELHVSESSTHYRMYVNPDLDAGQPDTPGAEYFLAGTTLPTSLILSNDGGFTTDEIRVATTWNEAVPPPVTACFSVDGPADVGACAGQTASFTASPVGSAGPFTYQWYRGPARLSDGPTGFGSVIDGAHAATLVVSGLTSADASFYYALVTDPCGDALSAAADLAVASTCCRADWDHNGGVNSTDVSNFINDWFADQSQGTLLTDWDANGVVNSTDVSAFINAWFEDTGGGCR